MKTASPTPTGPRSANRPGRTPGPPAVTAGPGRGFPELTDPTDSERFRGAFAVVILPTLNEEKGLARTLSELPFDHFDEPGQRVVPVVIDGGSTDGTLAVAQRWGVPVLRQTGRGKGAAMPFFVVIAWKRPNGGKAALGNNWARRCRSHCSSA